MLSPGELRSLEKRKNYRGEVSDSFVGDGIKGVGGKGLLREHLRYLEFL